MGIGQKAGVNWPGQQAAQQPRQPRQRRRPTSNQGHRQNDRKASSTSMGEARLDSALENVFLWTDSRRAPIWVSGRPSSPAGFERTNLAECTFPGECACVCARHTSAPLPAPFAAFSFPGCFDMFHAPRPVDGFLFALSCKVVNSFNRNPPSASRCWIYAPSSVISFGLTQIFGSGHIAPICWTNKTHGTTRGRIVAVVDQLSITFYCSILVECMPIFALRITSKCWS